MTAGSSVSKKTPPAPAGSIRIGERLKFTEETCGPSCMSQQIYYTVAHWHHPGGYMPVDLVTFADETSPRLKYGMQPVT